MLFEFHSVYWLVIIAFVLLMGAAFFFLQEIYSKKEDVFDDLIEAQEALERTKEEDRQRADEEFKKKIEEQVGSLDRTSRAMFAAMKKNADMQDENLVKMQKKIDKVIDEQNAGIKTLIKYNKENARQVALSGKASLEEVLNGLTASLQDIKEAASKTVYVDAPAVKSIKEDISNERDEIKYQAEPEDIENLIQETSGAEETTVDENINPDEFVPQASAEDISDINLDELNLENVDNGTNETTDNVDNTEPEVTEDPLAGLLNTEPEATEDPLAGLVNTEPEAAEDPLTGLLNTEPENGVLIND